MSRQIMARSRERTAAPKRLLARSLKAGQRIKEIQGDRMNSAGVEPRQEHRNVAKRFSP
jgi:hypothetical protein